MNEETKIYNDGLENKPNDEQTKDEVGNQDDSSSSKSGVPGYISLGVGVAAGLGAGIFGAQYAYGNVFNQEPVAVEESPIPEGSFLTELLIKADTEIATAVNDDMSLEEAYASAREEIGAGGVFVWNGSVYGTYDEEEWNTLSEDQQNDYYSNFSLQTDETKTDILNEGIDVSTMVNDDMSFGEAFAAARDELGAGGVFMWNGNAYNTYYKEEWADMAQADKDSFIEDYLDIPDDQLVYEAEIPDDASIYEPELEVGDIDTDLTALEDDVIELNEQDMVYEDIPVAEPVYDYNEEDVTYEAEPVYDGPGLKVNTPVQTTNDDVAEAEFTIDDFSEMAHTVNNVAKAIDHNLDEAIPDELLGGLGVISDVSHVFSSGKAIFDLFKGDNSVEDLY